MSDVQVDLAKAVVARIEGATLPESFAVARTYRIVPLQAKELSQFQVRVVLGNRVSSMSARRIAQRNVTVLVGMQRKLDAQNAEASGDAANEFATAVEELFLGQPLAGVDDADRHYSFVESSFTTPFDPEHAAEEHVFSTLLSLTYRHAFEI